MPDQPLFPTLFAEKLGLALNIMEEHGPGFDKKKYYERNIMMQDFQRMALHCSFDSSMIAFYGEKLSEIQLKGLETIFNSTKPYAMGNATNVLLEKIKEPTISGKDAKEIYIAISESCGENGNYGVNGSKGGKKAQNGHLTIITSEEEEEEA